MSTAKKLKLIPDPGENYLESWLIAERPAGTEPLTMIMADMCDRYAKVYGESVNYGINDLAAWRRTLAGKSSGRHRPVPQKICDMMRAELIHHALGLDFGESFSAELVSYLGLPKVV